MMMHFQTSVVYKALVHAVMEKKLVQGIKIMKNRTKYSLSLQKMDCNRFIWRFFFTTINFFLGKENVVNLS